MKEDEFLVKLIDNYGFNYTDAKKVWREENNMFILSCIQLAHDKGYRKGKESKNMDGWGTFQ